MYALFLASNICNVFDVVRNRLDVSLARRRDEDRREVDHDNRVRLVRACPDEFEHIIWYVTRYIVHCPSRGVAPNDWCLRVL